MRLVSQSLLFRFFFFSAPATTEIYTLSLHDALPISRLLAAERVGTRPLLTQDRRSTARRARRVVGVEHEAVRRSEEHTSELQSQSNIVCRLLLEKKKVSAQRAIGFVTTRTRIRDSHQ